MSDLSNGWVEAGFSLVALGIDTPEGVKISRALLFTSLSTGVLKIFVNRERPDKSNNTSWPSGHTSSMFALAGALTYSYGLSAAVPAYSAAGLVALSRMRENKHWLSDVVAGAFIGTYWARVSYSVVDENAMSLMPVPVDDGMIIVFQKSL
jgi:membrane-associated phospholipid phosphatase